MGRLMNNYYYGKAGKKDFKKNDLPSNRWQLFWEMLRIRFSGIIRTNLMTLLVFIPMIAVIFFQGSNLMIELGTLSNFDETGHLDSAYVEQAELDESTVTQVEDAYAAIINDAAQNNRNPLWERIYYYLFYTALYLIPCILITGPVQAGMAYVMRNWARDEHAFIWSDFRDAVKDNWKQGLLISGITSVVPFLMVVGWHFYNGMYETSNSMLYLVPASLCIMLGIIWFLSLVFSYPMLVGYQVTATQLIRNSVMLAVARLPHTVGMRLVTLVPTLLAVLVYFLFNIPWIYAAIFVLAYYLLLGNALTRFIYAAFTNGIFEKYMNPHIEGARTNIGLNTDPDDEDDEDEEENADPESVTK